MALIWIWTLFFWSYFGWILVDNFTDSSFLKNEQIDRYFEIIAIESYPRLRVWTILQEYSIELQCDLKYLVKVSPLSSWLGENILATFPKQKLLQKKKAQLSTESSLMRWCELRTYQILSIKSKEFSPFSLDFFILVIYYFTVLEIFPIWSLQFSFRFPNDTLRAIHLMIQHDDKE